MCTALSFRVLPTSTVISTGPSGSKALAWKSGGVAKPTILSTLASLAAPPRRYLSYHLQPYWHHAQQHQRHCWQQRRHGRRHPPCLRRGLSDSSTGPQIAPALADLRAGRSLRYATRAMMQQIHMITISLRFPRGCSVARSQHHCCPFHTDASLASGVRQLPIGKSLPSLQRWMQKCKRGFLATACCAQGGTSAR